MAGELIPMFIGWKDYTLSFLPRLLDSLIIIFVGIIIGKITGKITYIFLKKIKIDEYLSTDYFTINFSGITATFIRWWIYLAFLSAAFSKDVLGVETLSDWIMEINNFIPKIVGASLVFLVGLLLGEYVRDQIEYTKTFYSKTVSKVVFFFIIYIAFAISLDMVGIPTGLINSILLITLGSIGLGFAIAFGLGFKGVFEEAAKKYKYQKSKKKVRKHNKRQ